MEDIVALVVGEPHILHLDRRVERQRPLGGIGELGQVEELSRVRDGILHGLQ